MDGLVNVVMSYEHSEQEGGRCTESPHHTSLPQSTVQVRFKNPCRGSNPELKYFKTLFERSLVSRCARIHQCTGMIAMRAAQFQTNTSS